MDAGTAIGLAKFRPLTSEGLINAAPTCILVMSGGLESVGGVDGLLKLPGVGQTPAGAARRDRRHGRRRPAHLRHPLRPGGAGPGRRAALPGPAMTATDTRPATGDTGVGRDRRRPVRRGPVLLAGLAAGLLLVALIAAGRGQVAVAPAEVLGSVLHRLGLDLGPRPPPRTARARCGWSASPGSRSPPWSAPRSAVPVR